MRQRQSLPSQGFWVAFFFFPTETLVPAIPKRRLSEFSPPILTFQIAFVLTFSVLGNVGV